MSKVDDYYRTVTEVNRLLKEVFETESKQNAWYYYPVSKLNLKIPATLIRTSLEDANKVLEALKELEGGE